MLIARTTSMPWFYSAIIKHDNIIIVYLQLCIRLEAWFLIILNSMLLSIVNSTTVNFRRSAGSCRCPILIIILCCLHSIPWMISKTVEWKRTLAWCRKHNSMHKVFGRHKHNTRLLLNQVRFIVYGNIGSSP